MIPYVMLYTAVAGLPILLAALAVAAILRRYGRAERAVWLSALVLAFALPAASLLDPARGTPLVGAPPVSDVTGLPEVVALPLPSSSLDLGELLVALWVGVSVTMAIRWMVATVRLARSARSWEPGALNGVAVLMTDDVGPAVSGVLRPKVLAPRWLTSLPPRPRELILMHEEEHVRARDPLLVAVGRAARILTPWNPVVWILTARLVRAVELDCDRRVLRRTTDVAAYGHTLLEVSARRPGRLLAVAAFAESEAPLRSRILAMTTPSRSISIAAILAATVIGVVLLVGSLRIPVPTVSVDVQVGMTDRTPTVTAFDAPPTPPPPPPPAIEAPSRIVVRYQLDEQGETAPVRQPPEPEPTPMTVRPVLANAQEVSRALAREYPPLLRDAGIGGAPVLRIHITTAGDVDDAQVLESSGHEALDGAAVNVARAMKFRPARNGEAVTDAWVQIPVRFQSAR